MLVTLAIFTAALTPCQTTRPALPANLPKDWPPLPDFTRTIDYVKWFEESVNKGITDDACPLWDELEHLDSDPPDVAKAKSLMWGEESEDKGIPGLMTGSEPAPAHLAWDLKDHPDWEKAYQSQKQCGLHEKLLAATRRKQLTSNINWVAPNTPASRPGSVPQEVDWGITRDDHVLLNVFLAPSARRRTSARVLLQNAWRAPDGRADPDALVEAVETVLRMAHQLENRRRPLIEFLLAVSLRVQAYNTALRALDESWLRDKQVKELDSFLAREDRAKIDVLFSVTSEIAPLADFLQFAYLPPDGVWRNPPRLNEANIRKLIKFIQAEYKVDPQLSPAPLDVTGLINRCDPFVAIRQLVDLHLGLQDAVRKRLPAEAARQISERFAAFKDDPRTHVLLRQLSWDPVRAYLIVTRAETHRRATRLLFALFRYHDRTGKWPEALRQSSLGVSLETRTDLFSGKDFIYRVENDRPLLYSAATNARDDGGKHDEQWGEDGQDDKQQIKAADYVFFPVQYPRRQP